LAINKVIGKKSVIKIMDNLIDDWPLTCGGETTFQLIDNNLSILSGD